MNNTANEGKYSWFCLNCLLEVGNIRLATLKNGKSVDHNISIKFNYNTSNIKLNIIQIYKILRHVMRGRIPNIGLVTK